MQAIVCDQYGGPEVLRLAEAERPSPAEGQVLVEVAATSVNAADTVQRRGNYPPPPGESEILGLEVAGRVVRAGPGVEGWKPGDRVMGLVGGGGYAQYATAWAEHLMAVPENLSLEQAAAVSETYITAYLNIFLLGGIQDGETILIHGGGGGVNTAAIQLCRTLAPQAKVIVTASTGKEERVRNLGADLVVNYQARDFAAEVLAYTAGRGTDLILDHVGAKYLEPNLKCLAIGGRLMVIGITGGSRGMLELGRLMVKRQRIIGSVLRARPVQEKGAIVRRFSQAVLPRLADGSITPVIHAVLPLAQAAEAHRMLEASRHFGKIVLRVA